MSKIIRIFLKKIILNDIILGAHLLAIFDCQLLKMSPFFVGSEVYSFLYIGIFIVLGVYRDLSQPWTS